MAPEEKSLVLGADAAVIASEASGAIARRAPRKERGAVWTFGLRAGSIVAMIVFWWLTTFLFPPSLIPHPFDTFKEVGAIVNTGQFFSEMGATLRRVGVGFAIAMLIAIPLGIFMGTVKWLENFFEPPVILGLTMPGLVWAVMSIMFFGLNETSAYAAVAITIMPMLAISLWQGTKSMVARIRAAWQELLKGVQNDEEHFRKYAKRFFGLEAAEELKLGWPRTKQFFLPPDFAWPDKANLDIEKKYLRESTEMGIFPKESLGVIDRMFIP
jgi:hypothetical protein